MNIIDTSKAVVVGDNLGSDILGGNQAGIATIWYNPHGVPLRGAARPTYTAADFETVAAIISGKRMRSFNNMRKLIPLTLLVLLLAAGCTGGQTPSDVGVETTAPGPSPSAQAEVTPTPAPTPAPTPYDYTAPVPEGEAVADEWFADAVFIGDSRTDGLRLYSGIKDVDFLCYKGLTVFEVMDDKAVIQTDDGSIGVLQALGQKQYAKIYLMLGINELGYYNDQGFADTYSAVVDQIMELQPDADIYLQTLIPVSTEKCQETNQPYYVTNEQIAVYNEIIEKIAAEKDVYLVNVQEALVNEDGELPADASSDGIHFHKEGYQTWYAYLKTHTAEEGS